jgi:hypothetical protein
MMEVRDYRPEDKEALETIHKAQGIDYTFPDLDHPLFFVKKVILSNGKLVGALVLKICAETFLLLDGQQKPQDKFAEMQHLQRSVLSEAYLNGLDEIHAAIPPIGFDRRLIQLEWSPDRDGWRLWSRRTADALSSGTGR